MAGRETAAMALTRRVLAERGLVLRDVIAEGREIDPETNEPRKTWDDLAYEIRRIMEEAGEEMRLVRETVYNWAERYGVAHRDAPEPEPEAQDLAEVPGYPGYPG